MRHHSTIKKFGREKKVREGLMIGLMKSLIEHGRIETTITKAKALRPFIERLVSKAKDSSARGRRYTGIRLRNDVKLTKKLHDEIAPKYASREGGYTRVTKTGVTTSDDTAVIEFV